MKGRPPPKLTDEARTFVVQGLACFGTPTEMVRAVRERFGLEISAQGCEAYDPTKRAGWNLAEKWMAIFQATRAAFVAEMETVGVAHRSVRLSKLDQLCTHAMQAANLALAARVMEQAAREVGGAYATGRSHRH